MASILCETGRSLILSIMTSLNNYGWNSIHQAYFTKNEKKDLSIGRVVSIKGFRYYLITENGEIETELSGKLLFGTVQEELPKVGDWVFFMDYDTIGYIISVFPRTNELSRKNPGNKIQKQVLAANVDYAFIVQGLDRDFNIMRLERYLVQITACGIKPIVILNKADLIDNPDAFKVEVEKLQRDCPIYFCSTLTGQGINELTCQCLEMHKTYILIGSSGVGKSSLLNSFLDLSVQRTGNTSDATFKGKHTTTTRDLFRLPNGSLIIDTPGMREFGLTFEEGESDELFPVIKKIGDGCRFADCKHINETGCAVLDALGSGELSMEIYESYVKLMKEQKRFEIKVEDKKRLGKQFGKMAREANNHRKKNKY